MENRLNKPLRSGECTKDLEPTLMKNPPLYDSSLADDERVVFDKVCPFELRMQNSLDEPQETGMIQHIGCRIICKGGGCGQDSKTPHSVSIELTCEADLFFHYKQRVSRGHYEEIKEEEKLTADFIDYPRFVAKMINSCLKEPCSFIAIFVLQKDGKGRLEFVENMEYKFVKLFAMDFIKSPEEEMRRSVTFRYNSTKALLAITQAKLQDFNTILKARNPALYRHVMKESPPKSRIY